MIDCPFCKGLGFHEGKICVCITGKRDGELPEFMKDIFEAFSTTPDKKEDKGRGK